MLRSILHRALRRLRAWDAPTAYALCALFGLGAYTAGYGLVRGTGFLEIRRRVGCVVYAYQLDGPFTETWVVDRRAPSWRRLHACTKLVYAPAIELECALRAQ